MTIDDIFEKLTTVEDVKNFALATKYSENNQFSDEQIIEITKALYPPALVTRAIEGDVEARMEIAVASYKKGSEDFGDCEDSRKLSFFQFLTGFFWSEKVEDAKSQERKLVAEIEKQGDGLLPYKDIRLNLIYNLLFCDNLELYKQLTTASESYPFDILFADNSSTADLQKIIDDTRADPRQKYIAYSRQIAKGHKPDKRELLAVIVEVGLDKGLDVLVVFNDGTARYINQYEKIIFWEKTDDPDANKLSKQIFDHSLIIANQLVESWDKPRKPSPAKDMFRINFLVSGALYLGDGPCNKIITDPHAKAIFDSAALFMHYITQSFLKEE